MNDFSNAFAEFSKLDDMAPVPPAPLAADTAPAAAAPAGDAPADPAPAEPASTEPAAAKPDGEAPAEPASTEPASTEPAAAKPEGEAPAEPASAKPEGAAPAKPAEPKFDDRDQALLDALGRIAAEGKKPEAASAQPADEEFKFTPEQQRIIDDFQKEYPEIHSAQQLIMTQQLADYTSWLFDQLVPQLTTIRDIALSTAGAVHHNELTTSIPNYNDQLIDDIENWVGTQPSFLQDGMKRVINEGTAAEIRSLVDMYAKATGVSLTPAPASPAAPANPQPKAVELPSPAKQAAEKLAPVNSQRTAPVLPSDPNDFSGAFRKASEEVQ